MKAKASFADIEPGKYRVAGSIRRARSVSYLPEDRPIAASLAIHRTNSVPLRLSEDAAAAHLPAEKSSRPELPRIDRPSTSDPGSLLRHLRNLRAMSHGGPEDLERLADYRLMSIGRDVDSLEARWRSMGQWGRLTRQGRRDIRDTGEEFELLHGSYGVTEKRLDMWKNKSIPGTFDLPAMKATGDSSYRLVGNYLVLMNRMKLLKEEMTPAINLFIND